MVIDPSAEPLGRQREPTARGKAVCQQRIPLSCPGCGVSQEHLGNCRHLRVSAVTR